MCSGIRKRIWPPRRFVKLMHNNHQHHYCLQPLQPECSCLQDVPRRATVHRQAVHRPTFADWKSDFTVRSYDAPGLLDPLLRWPAWESEQHVSVVWRWFGSCEMNTDKGAGLESSFSGMCGVWPQYSNNIGRETRREEYDWDSVVQMHPGVFRHGTCLCTCK